MKRAQQIDPVLMPVAANLAFMYYSARRYDEAIEAAKKAIELDPGSPLAQERMGLSLELAGRPAEALPYFQNAVMQSDRAQTAIASLARSYAIAGDSGQARKLLSELQAREKEQYISSYNLALIYTALDDRQNALAKLEAAYDEGSIDLLLAKVDPRLDLLRSEPRFQQIIRKLFPA
jgi:tetratricopeptide (TPR) repeat protein